MPGRICVKIRRSNAQQQKDGCLLSSQCAKQNFPLKGINLLATPVDAFFIHLVERGRLRREGQLSRTDELRAAFEPLTGATHWIRLLRQHSTLITMKD
jgi:hypothetical protein